MDKRLSGDIHAMIGVEKIRHYDVTQKDIKHFAQAIGEKNPIHFDEDYAKKNGYCSNVATPLFCQIFTFDDVPAEQLPGDGSPVEIDVPIPAKRTVGGGSSYEIFRRVKAGDKITVRSILKDVYTKEGRSGLLYFIVVETAFTNQHDELVARETATYIKRI
jgi:acyl dehydratase